MSFIKSVIDELRSVLASKDWTAYHLLIPEDVFHITQACTCTHKVLYLRKHPEEEFHEGELDKSYNVIGIAFENEISKRLKWPKPKNFYNQHFRVFIPIGPLGSRVGYVGTIDIMASKGSSFLPIEIKTSASEDIGWYNNSMRLKIQAGAYAIGVMSKHYLTIIASKSSPQMDIFLNHVEDFVHVRGKDYELAFFLELKYNNLIRETDPALFSPMWNWECSNRNGKCVLFNDCPFVNSAPK